MKIILKILSWFALLIWLFPVYSGSLVNLRGQRYCEVLLAKEIIPRHIHVYNTIGLNNCPPALWNKLNLAQIKQQYNSRFVRLNGPRYWVIDGMQNSSLLNTEKYNFGGIEMREAGILELGTFDLLKMQPYHIHHVKRITTWVYQAGKPIYEISDAQGHVFVMQSYSTQKISQTEESLATLASRLKLPRGWNFRTRVLQKETTVTPINQKAEVLQDEFLNTYLLETPKIP
jgi:hypothetical protein